MDSSIAYLEIKKKSLKFKDKSKLLKVMPMGEWVELE